MDGVPDIVQETVIKTISKKRKCKKAIWFSEEGLQTTDKRSKRQRRKEKIYSFECRVPKNSKGEIRKLSPVFSVQRNRGKRE